MLMKQVLAAEIDISPRGDFSGLSSITLGGIIGGLVNFGILAAAIVFFFILVMGGIRWIMSQGDETKVKGAREQVTHALIGLAIVFAAWAVVTLIGNVFGVNIFQIEIPTFTGD